METAERVQEGVGRRIAELRDEIGLSQAELSQKLGMPVSNVQRIEYGFQNLTIKMVVRIARALGVTVAVLFEPPTKPRKRRAKPGRPKKVL